MILQRLYIRNFGGLTNREFHFRKGLNVVVGPNEAGKSTLFYAIDRVLFTPAKLNKRELKEQMQRFIPISGNTAEVSLEFSIDERAYRVRKVWGEVVDAELNAEDGAVIKGHSAVEKKLQEILPATTGTFRSVLMARQAGLSSTIDALRRDYKNTLVSLGDLLRRAVVETDGVSVEELKERIHTLYNEYFQRWDPRAEAPEGGITKRWKKGIGLIVKAFYRLEDIKEELSRAKEYEKLLDEINREISGYATEVKTLDEFVKKHAEHYKRFKESEKLILNKERLEEQLKELFRVSRDWPVREERIKQLKAETSLLEKRLTELNDEFKKAKEASEHRALREKLKRVSERMHILKEAQDSLKRLKPISDPVLKELIALEDEIKRLEAVTKAGSLYVRIKAKDKTGLSISTAIEGKQEFSLSRSEERQFTAGGFLEIEHREFIMEIQSGEGNIKELVERLENKRRKLSEKLKSFELDSIKQARMCNNEYNEKLREIEKLKGIIEAELDGDTYDALKQKVLSLPDASNIRSLDEISREQAEVNSDLGQKKRAIDDAEETIKGYLKEYGSLEDLFLLTGNKKHQLQKLTEQIDALGDPPEPYETAEAFIKDYEEKQIRLNSLNNTLNEARLKRAEIEAKAPETSVEELMEELKEREKDFEKTLRKGKAIACIRQAIEQVLSEVDSSTPDSLKERLENYISYITEKRYCKVEIDQHLPDKFIRQDGCTLPYELLSEGTKDAFSLALRLSMAEMFLEGTDGFLVLDDPLVDLDPDRQKRAAELLKRFSDEKQIIILTCHPGNAEILGGKTIEFTT